VKQISTIGLDLAKNVFQIHGADAEGAPVLNRKLRRVEVLRYFEKLPPCLDDRFQENCHMGGIHLPFQAPIYAVEGFETKDLAIWRHGGGRLNCRSEIWMWRS